MRGVGLGLGGRESEVDSELRGLTLPLCLVLACPGVTVGSVVAFSQDPTNGVTRLGIPIPIPQGAKDLHLIHSVSFPKSPATARNKLN